MRTNKVGYFVGSLSTMPITRVPARVLTVLSRQDVS